MDYADGGLNNARFRATATTQAVDAPFARFKAARRFQALDGWRAFAIIAVIWHHTLTDSFTSPIAYEGRHGVTLFFVISGFLIVTLLLRARESPHGFSLWRFWGRRSLRILPIYYAVLAIYIGLVYLQRASDATADFFANLPYFATFTTNWFVDVHGRTIFYFSWSLAAEEQFYLLWPLVEVLIARPAYKLVLLGVLVVASQVALAHELAARGTGDLPLRMLSNVPLGIMLGTGLAHLLNREASYRVIDAVLGRRGSAAACLAFAGFIAIVFPYVGFAGEVLVPVALLLLVTATVIREDNDLAGLLQWRPIAWIGTVSYGMYMMHMLAVNLVRKSGSVLHVESGALVFTAAVGVACAIASISFLCYERPFLVLKDRLFRN